MKNLRTHLLATAAFCFAALAIALYLQHARDLLPCPLCVIQRYAFLATGLFCLAAAGARRPRLWTGLALASTAVGAGYVTEHLYVLAHPGLSCGIDPLETMLNKIPTAVYLPWMFRADGLCEDALDRLFGLSVPQWSALAFAMVGASLAAALLRRR